MGCFPACFGHWRQKETMKKVQDQSNLSPSHESVKLLQSTTESLKKEETVNPIKLVSEAKIEEQLSYEKETVFDHSNVEKDTNELISSNSDKLVENENEKVENEGDSDKLDYGLKSKLSNRIPYSANHDFLINGKDSCVAANSKEISLECCPVQEESSESLFSLSIDSRKYVFAAEMGEKEVSSPLKKSDHMLVKNEEKTSFKYDEEKENVPFSKDPIIKQSLDESKPNSDFDQFKKRDREIAVDTSLSSWLIESEKSPQKTSVGNNSPESEKNYGNRRILGAITSAAEIKQLNESSSAASTPSPCCSADDQLGIGTVGRYWQQRGLAGEMVSPVWT